MSPVKPRLFELRIPPPPLVARLLGAGTVVLVLLLWWLATLGDSPETGGYRRSSFRRPLRSQRASGPCGPSAGWWQASLPR